MPQSATPLYFAVMAELERRRLELGIPMWKLCDAAGVASRYYAKALYPMTPSGRQAQWETLAPFVEVLFPNGPDVKIKDKKKRCAPASAHKVSIRFSGARYEYEARKDWMRELSKLGASKGGRATANKLSKKRRIANARRAAKKRWSKPSIVEITGEGHGYTATDKPSLRAGEDQESSLAEGRRRRSGARTI